MNDNDYESLISEIYDDNLRDIKSGLYGKFIEDKGDGIYAIHDGTRQVEMKIEGNHVVFCNTYTTYPCQWVKALPIISIKDLRYEQLYFENRTQMLTTDEIFAQPNYYNVAKSRTAELIYITPLQYMELCASGFDSTFDRQIEQTNKERIIKYANDILKGDLFPLMSIEYYRDGFTQEGRHRATAIQYLIDLGKIPEDTEIPVIIVSEV